MTPTIEAVERRMLASTTPADPVAEVPGSAVQDAVMTAELKLVRNTARPMGLLDNVMADSLGQAMRDAVMGRLSGNGPA